MPKRAAQSSSSRLTEITEVAVNVTGAASAPPSLPPPPPRRPGRVSLLPDSLSINQQIGARHGNVHGEVVSV